MIGLALSSHVGLNGDYNETHPHVRLQHDQYIAGVYKNSESNTSSYLGYRFETLESTFLEAGIVAGYSGLPVAPFLRVGVGITDSLSLFLTPAYEPKGNRVGAAIGVEYSVPLFQTGEEK